MNKNMHMDYVITNPKGWNEINSDEFYNDFIDLVEQYGYQCGGGYNFVDARNTKISYRRIKVKE